MPYARGFTILELMIAMAIFTVICGAMFRIAAALAAEVLERNTVIWRVSGNPAGR